MRFSGSDGVSIIGVGMTPQSRRDMQPGEMALQAASEALQDAGLSAKQVKLAVVSNALGGALCEQECIRGQSWLNGIGFEGTGVVNVENACAGGVNAFHLASLAALAGESPILVVAVEKMWTGDRQATMEAIEEGLPSQERISKRKDLGDNPSGSVFMGLNASWARRQLESRETTVTHLAAAASKARFHGSLNPLAQHRSPLSIEEILSAPTVVAPLTRPMCSSFTDGAAALVIKSGAIANAPQVVASVLLSGDGSVEYHDRMAAAGAAAFEESGFGPEDIDVVEVHDATSAEELLALEALGFYPEGKSGAATLAGDTYVGGSGVTVNPSGGLVARGHPIGATGACQLVELATQLRGRAGERQSEGARLAMAVNTGGIIGDDVASVGVVILRQG